MQEMDSFNNTVLLYEHLCSKYDIIKIAANLIHIFQTTILKLKKYTEWFIFYKKCYKNNNHLSKIVNKFTQISTNIRVSSWLRQVSSFKEKTPILQISVEIMALAKRYWGLTSILLGIDFYSIGDWLRRHWGLTQAPLGINSCDPLIGLRRAKGSTSCPRARYRSSEGSA